MLFSSHLPLTIHIEMLKRCLLLITMVLCLYLPLSLSQTTEGVKNTIRFNRGELSVSPSDSMTFTSTSTLSQDSDSDSEEFSLYLVTFQPEVIADAAHTLGDRVAGYLPDNTFLVLTTRADAEAISKYRGLVYINKYPTTVKTSERLEGLLQSMASHG